VVLIGERWLYWLLPPSIRNWRALQGAGRLRDALERGPAAEAGYAQMVAALARDAALQPLDAPAVRG